MIDAADEPRPLRSLLRELAHPDDVEILARAPLWQLFRPGFGGELALAELHETTRRRFAALSALVRESWGSEPPPAMRRGEDVARALGPRLRAEAVECFYVLALDVRHRLLASLEVSRGTLSASLVHPREVFRPAMIAAAAAVIVVHNHPSGDPAPSPEDDAVTRRLAAAGELLGIPLLDHVILGTGAHWSYASRRPGLLGGGG